MLINKIFVVVVVPVKKYENLNIKNIIKQTNKKRKKKYENYRIKVNYTIGLSFIVITIQKRKT